MRGGAVEALRTGVSQADMTTAIAAAKIPETQSVTATVTGATTGTIADPASGSVFVTVTSDSAVKKILLPTATPGTKVSLRNGATGYVLDSAATINGAANVSIPANTLADCFCDTAGTWLCEMRSIVGTEIATIHNYFPDGRVTDVARIDTTNEFAEGTLWHGNNGTETISKDTWEGHAWLKCVLSGDDWGEGVTIRDLSYTFPAGRYRVGVTIGVASPVPSTISIRTAAFTFESSPEYNIDSVDYYGNMYIRRTLADILLLEPGTIGLGIWVENRVNPTLVDEPTGTIYVRDLMITEGDPALYADGASAGWSWSGAANASISSGPQP